MEALLVGRCQHIIEGVHARIASGQPDGCGNRAAREYIPIAGAMGKFQALAVGGEKHGVLADDIAAAQRSETDIARSRARPA